MKKFVCVLLLICVTGTMLFAQQGGKSAPGGKPPALPPDGKPGAGGQPPEGMPPEGMVPDGFGTIADAKEPDLTAVLVVDGKTKTLKKVSYSSAESDTSVLLAENGATVTVNGGSLKKTGGDTSSEDQSNFYGLNSAVVATGGSSITLSGVTITSDADGSNAVFATGDDAVIRISDSTIATTENSSRGLDATYNGTVIASNITISTQGDHCAAFATDRGEGTITVTGGTAETHGDGSPVIYSTGNISVTGVTGTAYDSEMAVIEGKNSITISNSDLTGYAKKGIMLYQSMSGDASIGTSVFTATGSKLTNAGSGPFFYITNTSSEINISGCTLNGVGDVLIQCSGNNSERGWGKQGANGGTLTFTASNQQLTGEITCDAISSVTAELKDNSSWSGAADTADEGNVSIILDDGSTWIVTGDSYVSALTDADSTCSNIILNGHTVWYDAGNSANVWLHGATITDSNGGCITPAR